MKNTGKANFCPFIKVPVVTLALITLIGFNALEAKAQCNPVPTDKITFKHQGKDYFLVRDKKPYLTASTCAVAMGGYLAIINDADEQAAIFAAIKANVAATYHPVNDGGGASYVWIGASDMQNEGTWKWSKNNVEFFKGKANSGTATGYHNWGGKSSGTLNEPDDYGAQQDCAAIGLSSWPTGSGTPLGKEGEWNDILATNTLYYVVETGFPTGVDERQTSIFKVFPNPAKGVLTIQNPYEGTINIHIQSIEGKVLFSEKIMDKNHIELNISNIPVGLYYLHVTNEDQTLFVEKLIVE